MRYSFLDLFCNPLESVDLVVRCEELGFHRYWVGEHHTPNQCSNPLLLSGVLQGLTDQIRVGTGAVGLYGRSPFLVAEDARLVSYLYGDRFDLGVTRGLAFAKPSLVPFVVDGRDLETLKATFDQRICQLHAFLTGRANDVVPEVDHLYLETPPPPLWLLGMSAGSGRVAARLGIGFCTSLHHARDVAKMRAAIQAYREYFTPSPELAEPYVILVQSGVCLESAAAVDALWGEFCQGLGEAKAAEASAQLDQLFFGDPDQCAATMLEVWRDYAPDELMLLIHPAVQQKFHSLGLLAEALETVSSEVGRV